MTTLRHIRQRLRDIFGGHNLGGKATSIQWVKTRWISAAKYPTVQWGIVQPVMLRLRNSTLKVQTHTTLRYESFGKAVQNWGQTGFQILAPPFTSELRDMTKLLEFSEAQLPQLQNGEIYLIVFTLWRLNEIIHV